ncbi:MAG: hypothetical protein HFI78_08890 [Lachnospiraceae bacterium]|jgi:hypothetical protein|nr:hypothetical protein [Lachnospiraceae bacterium]
MVDTVYEQSLKRIENKLKRQGISLWDTKDVFLTYAGFLIEDEDVIK